MQHIGVDIIEIDRIKQTISHWGDKFLQRVFTPAELKLYRQKTASLAARFAAKEAVYKLLGACNLGISWREIEIITERNSKPVVHLSGKAQSAAGELAIKDIAITLSHSEHYAVAFAVGITDD